MTHKRILIRESKTPFDIVWREQIPEHAFRRVYNSQHRNGMKNYGNLMFGHAAYKVLSAPGVEFGIDRYGLTLRDYTDREIGEINDSYDAVVLPMDDAFRLAAKGKELVGRLARNVSKLKIPVTIVGVGARFGVDKVDFSDLDPMKAEIKQLIAGIMDRTESMAVRGEVTRDYLVHLGFSQDRIEVIGCPSIYYHGENLKVEKGPLGEVAFYYTPQTTDPRVLAFSDYYNRHSEGVTYIPQERALLQDFADGRIPRADSENSLKNPAPRLHRPENTAFLCDIVPWMDFLKTKSFSIGTRIHGNIVSILAGTPGHVICHDSRTLEMSRYLDIPHTTYAQLEDFDGAAAFERSDYTAMMRNHPARLAKYAKFLERNNLAHILYDQAALRAHDAKVRRAMDDAQLPGVIENHPLFRKIQGKVERLGRKAGLSLGVEQAHYAAAR